MPHSGGEMDSHIEVTASTDTLVSDTDKTTPTVTPADGVESSTSPLTAEAVAKSLLQKFANKKHPLASELHWLVSVFAKVRVMCVTQLTAFLANVFTPTQKIGN